MNMFFHKANNISHSSVDNGISVVVCTHNGLSRLTPTLLSLFRQKIPAGLLWEILIVDNDSTDGTAAFCYDFKNKHQFNGAFEVVAEMKPGLNYARRKGLTEAKYNWVLFCDDDNHLFEDYVHCGFQILSSNNKIGALGSLGIPLFESDKPDWFDQYSHSYAVGPQSSASGKISAKFPELYGAGCFFYKPALTHLFDAGFQTVMSDRKGKSLSSGGDVEWCYLVRLMGYDIWFSDQLKFYHLMPPQRLTWQYYVNLKAGIGKGTALLFSYHFYFEKGKRASLIYLCHYLLHWVKACTVFFFVMIKNLLNFESKTNNKKMLGISTLKAKAGSFSFHWRASLKHYAQIKHRMRSVDLQSH